MSIELPKGNFLESGKDNSEVLGCIEKFARSVHYKIEGMKFSSEFSFIRRRIEGIRAGTHKNSSDARSCLVEDLKKLTKLKALLKDNTCCVSLECIEELIEKVEQGEINDINDDLDSYINSCLLSENFIHSEEVDRFSHESISGINLY